MEPTDKITLQGALDTSIWKMVWAGEPNRKIAVYMTYGDLIWVCELIDKQKVEEEG